MRNNDLQRDALRLNRVSPQPWQSSRTNL